MPKKSKGKGRKPRRRQGLRVRASEGSNLIQGGRATEYTPPRLMGGMQPFLNSGIIAPPPLMQVPYGYRELNRSIPAMPYVKDDAMDTSSTIYIPSVQEQIREAFANLMEVQTYADLQKLTPPVVEARLKELVKANELAKQRATNSSSSSSSSTPMGPMLNEVQQPRLNSNTGVKTVQDAMEDEERENEDDDEEFQDARSRAADDEVDAITDRLRRI